MALSAGTRLGPYEIVALLGAGGMGEVYRARDTVLGREVAVKVLPEAMAGDPDRLIRFDREARLLASISHPAIAHVYGVEAWKSSRAIVMELVPGPTLADRIAQGALTLVEALPLARQTAEALATAHDQGIVHRDLKPANIKASENGVVKVLDFGLAKTLLEDPLAAAEASTVVSPALTAQGVILGTAAYMSPEQARGKVIDKRTDVWAFGCVLFEMLTGARAFPGEDVLDTATSVLKQEPDWSRLPAGTPAVIRTLLRRCLAKDRTKRLADLHDATLVIDDVVVGVDRVSDAAPRPSRWPLAFAWTVAAIAIAIAASLVWSRWRRQDPVELSLDIATPRTTDSTMFALSPDGHRLVFMAYSGDVPVLWLRDLRGAGVAQPMAGTGGASFPFWSPTSESIGFFAGGQLKLVDLAQGTVRNLTPAPNPRGGAWSNYAGGTIVYALGLDKGIWRVSSGGGAPSQIMKLQPGQIELRHPRFLDDGRRFFFAAQSNRNPQAEAPGGLFVADVDDGRAVRLTSAASQALLLPGNRVMFLKDGLTVQSLDASGTSLVGEPALARPDVHPGLLSGGAFSWRAGTLAYRRIVSFVGQLQWFDRRGSPMEQVGAPGVGGGGYGGVELSPDGRRAAFSRERDVITIDLSTGRETPQAQSSSRAVWSSDSRAIFFQRVDTIFRKAVDTDEAEVKIIASAPPMDVSVDGRRLLYGVLSEQGAHDLWIHPLDGAEDVPIARTAAREYQGQLRPDGEWVAYTSNQSGQPEIWMKRLDEKSSPKRVSDGGGLMPRWSWDGRELFFVSLDADMTVVPVATEGNSVRFGAQQRLFRAPIDLELFQGTGVSAFYDVARDGRFLINVDRTERPPITLVLNWQPPAAR